MLYKSVYRYVRACVAWEIIDCQDIFTNGTKTDTQQNTNAQENRKHVFEKCILNFGHIHSNHQGNR